jgi:FKBP-type peptidyl-prolyl cis-trans isomerase
MANFISKTTNLFLFSALFILMISCDKIGRFEKEEQNKINAYLVANPDKNFQNQTYFYYYEKTTGTGVSPQMGDSAAVWYTVRLFDGTVLDTNMGTGQPLYKFIVGENIYAFSHGLLLMKVGGTATILAPSSSAYGGSEIYKVDQTTGEETYIPGYTPLLIDVELVSVKPNN